MGFTLPRLDQVTLEFEEGTALEGLTAVCKSTSARDVDRLVREMDLPGAAERFLNDYLIEWDAEDEQGPLPADENALERIEPWMVGQLLLAFARGLYRVPGPLGTRSTSGASPTGS